MPCTFTHIAKLVFGTSLKPPYDKSTPSTCGRVEEFHKFLNWSWFPILTPWAVSTVFSRRGFHGKVFLFLLWGLLAFFITLSIYMDHTHDKDDPTHMSLEVVQTFSSSSISLATRLLTFTLSSYVGIIVANYWTNVRRKTRNMNYGLSNAVDTIATTMDYNHPNARVLLDSIYGPLVVIGQYGLAIASKTSKYKKSKDEILELFDRHNLDGTYLLKTYPPKQIMHTLRLAILQEIQKERHDAASSCLHYMSNEDFIELRKQLNDYCGWASSTSSSVSSSKLPYGYVQFINWSTHAVLLMCVYQMFQEQGYRWSKAGICWTFTHRLCRETDRHARHVEIYQFVFFVLFKIIILYFVLGCLELYYVLEQSFSSGLVVQNYYGIIELICAPLSKTTLTAYCDDVDAACRTSYNGPIELHRLQKK